MQSQSRSQVSPRNIFFFVVSALLFFLMISAVLDLGRKYLALREKIDDLSEQKRSLEHKQEELARENEYLATPEGEEHVLREKYQLVKPGEGLIIITSPDPDQNTKNGVKKGIGKWWDSILRGLGIRK